MNVNLQDEDSSSSITNMDNETDLSQMDPLEISKEERVNNSQQLVNAHHGYKVCFE